MKGIQGCLTSRATDVLRPATDAMGDAPDCEDETSRGVLTHLS